MGCPQVAQFGVPGNTIRGEREAPIVDALFARLDKVVADGNLLPKSEVARAVGYMLGRPDSFRRYLHDPNLRMDNNAAERGLRKLTVGRKNWLFVGSLDAGNSMAVLLSLVQTARALNLNVHDYLTDLFQHLLDHPANQIDDFLPDQWLTTRAHIQQ